MSTTLVSSDRRVALVSTGRRDEVGAPLMAELLRVHGRRFRVDVCALGSDAAANRVAARAIVAADAVIFVGGSETAAVARDPAVIASLPIDAARQVIAGQCAGALFLSYLGLLAYRRVAADGVTRSLLEQRGHHVVAQSFCADEQVASAAGILAAPYVAAWVAWRLAGRQAATALLEAAAPIGQRQTFATHHLRALTAVAPRESVDER